MKVHRMGTRNGLQGVDEVAGLADNAPAADVRVVDPGGVAIQRYASRIDPVDHG